MTKSAKRLAAILDMDEPNPMAEEALLDETLRTVSETISALTFGPGPSGVPVIIEPSERAAGTGDHATVGQNASVETPGVDVTACATFSEPKGSVAETAQKKHVAPKTDEAAQDLPKRAAVQNNSMPLVMRRFGTNISEDGNETSNLNAVIETGGTVVELDPALVEESFIRDRMETGNESIAELTRQISEQGQIVPILVRPHPQKKGRYQAAFGHRRLKAVASLGRKIRAVIRPLTDVELIIAQGQENNARLDLSFIEKARFAAEMKAKKFDRATIAAALGISNQSQITWYLQVIERVPSGIIDAIGPAPEIGRKRWLPLAEVFQNDASALEKAKAFIRMPAFNARETNERFNALVEEVTRKDRSTRVEPSQWEAPDARVKATFSFTAKRCTLHIERNVDAGFSEFVINKLSKLYKEYKESMRAE